MIKVKIVKQINLNSIRVQAPWGTRYAVRRAFHLTNYYHPDLIWRETKTGFLSIFHADNIIEFECKQLVEEIRNIRCALGRWKKIDITVSKLYEPSKPSTLIADIFAYP